MPRRPRFILPNIPHHVIQRGNNRQSIFFEDKDYEFFKVRLQKCCLENHVKIGAYCLMTNHVHLLVYPESQNGMTKCIKMICQQYSQYVNRKYNRTGKLWENRYKIHWIDPDREWVLARYIEKNPLRAGMARHAEEYEYSSARGHLNGCPDDLLTRVFVDGRRQEAYRRYFYEEDHQERFENEQIRKMVEQEKAYGGAAFVRMLEQKLGSDPKRGQTPGSPVA